MASPRVLLYAVGLKEAVISITEDEWQGFRTMALVLRARPLRSIAQFWAYGELNLRRFAQQVSPGLVAAIGCIFPAFAGRQGNRQQSLRQPSIACNQFIAMDV